MDQARWTRLRSRWTFTHGTKYSNKTRRGGFASGVEKGRYRKEAKSRAGNKIGAKGRERHEDVRIVEAEEQEEKKKKSRRKERRLPRPKEATAELGPITFEDHCGKRPSSQELGWSGRASAEAYNNGDWPRRGGRDPDKTFSVGRRVFSNVKVRYGQG
ncbi:hypothetical protein IFM61606_05552 [Aspergillus udagawae]|uniref:Uncharacterized protein n=1 Tax=Aspergillus udagawae TaxID=91492 RepID=A0A8H3NJQ5_9EURO|nr:hypothetical protein IFM46972_03749 [Aspergillus udagawae]GFF58123.1 hypothetical protein IFM51744_09444 [Aspergillus udagawae]GFF83775.1 hypothetical protein IFM53868_03921 [Aspergillus udagawae]GFG08630.1 hypothetical protein IFM5058_04019 [Aspergillus udagawae]GFG25604.1 hypothetical protein IFM61606_05552 [Aspergillus udagawae]